MSDNKEGFELLQRDYNGSSSHEYDKSRFRQKINDESKPACTQNTHIYELINNVHTLIKSQKCN